MRRGIAATAASLPALLVAMATGAEPQPPPAIEPEVRQLVLVLVADWPATTGRLMRFSRDAAGRWREVGTMMDVVVGRGGSGWGLGRHRPEPAGPQKREGDGRSPAGVFTVGPAFGSGPRLETGLEYLPLDRGHWCIDVPDSPHYNRIVHVDQVTEAAVAGSSEPMRRDIHLSDDQYRLGFVIGHNPAAEPARGSCIFAHPWTDAATPTAGCVGMAEDSLRELLAWLDEAAAPRLVLLPAAEHQRLREPWGLPAWPEPLP